MNLCFNTSIINQYSSKSQIARVLTEQWVEHNSYCPCCGNTLLNCFPNNKPVADFFCANCNEQYELKSKKGVFSNIITDGAYLTMIERINSNSNPNFLFITYTKDWSVNNYLIIPKYFFTTNIIQKRKPLSDTAKRAGWIGCNINIETIPNSAKIFIVKDSNIIDKQAVIECYNKIKPLQVSNIDGRSWLIDILNCMDKIPSDNFTLNQMYSFEDELKRKHPNNQFIKQKIRQQLQYLRDKGFLSFTSRGNYIKNQPKF